MVLQLPSYSPSLHPDKLTRAPRNRTAAFVHRAKEQSETATHLLQISGLNLAVRDLKRGFGRRLQGLSAGAGASQLPKRLRLPQPRHGWPREDEAVGQKERAVSENWHRASVVWRAHLPGTS